MQNAGHQRVFGLQGLADGAAADDAQVAAGELGQHARAAGRQGRADVALDRRAAGQGLQAAAIAAAAHRAADLHDDVADLAGRLAGPAPQPSLLHQARADAGAHPNAHRRSAPCGPSPARSRRSVPRLPSLPTATGTWKRPSRWAPIDTPVRLMLGVTTTRADFGSTTPGTATPIAVRSAVATLALFSTSCDDRFDHRQDLLRSAGPRRRLPLLARTIPPDSRTNEAWTFVPPTSTPRYKRSLPATVWFFMLLPLLVRTGHSRLPARPMQETA